jgi:hypothetical protein
LLGEGPILPGGIVVIRFISANIGTIAVAAVVFGALAAIVARLLARAVKGISCGCDRDCGGCAYGKRGSASAPGDRDEGPR